MIDFPIEKILPLCAEFAPLSSEQIRQFNLYGNLLLEWNERINLTAITDPDEVVFKHFLDCLLFLKNINVPENARIIDVGTGAGFPGVVLKIARPDIKLTLLDSLNKRVNFLSDVIERLGLHNAVAVHSRAEEGARCPEYRELFDIATARAVAPLNILSEYCLPYVKKGGDFVSLKGPAAAEELQSARRAIAVLGGGDAAIFNEKLPNGDERLIIKVKKISQTSPKYPRNSGKISKQPL